MVKPSTKAAWRRACASTIGADTEADVRRKGRDGVRCDPAPRVADDRGCNIWTACEKL